MFGSTYTTPANKRMFGVFAGLALASQASAHLFIQHPTPIPGTGIKSPLKPDGSDFPCHGVDLASAQGPSQKFAAGSSNLLQFDDGGGANTAVHGGGSCQISVTYETAPEKIKDPKNWFVIHSMEGGCPTNSEGNLDGQYTGPQGPYSGAIQCSDPRSNGVDCINSYNFTIPQGLKEGKATLAWTWFNTIGNREMYMNCVNAQIEGTDGSAMSSLPTMFVANLAAPELPQCSTQEGQFYKFPYAGDQVTSDTKGSQYKLAAMTGGACADDGAPAGGAAPGGSSPGAGAAPSYGGGAPPASPPGKPAGDNGGSGAGQVTVTTMQTLTSGNTAPTSAPAPPVSSAAPSAAVPAPSSAAAPAPYASGSAPSSSGSGSCPSGAQPCSNDGEVVCMGTQWGLCNAGCAVPMELALGTHCVNGKIAKRDHVRRHIGRKHGRQFA